MKTWTTEWDICHLWDHQWMLRILHVSIRIHPKAKNVSASLQLRIKVFTCILSIRQNTWKSVPKLLDNCKILTQVSAFRINKLIKIRDNKKDGNFRIWFGMETGICSRHYLKVKSSFTWTASMPWRNYPSCDVFAFPGLYGYLEWKLNLINNLYFLSNAKDLKISSQRSNKLMEELHETKSFTFHNDTKHSLLLLKTKRFVQRQMIDFCIYPEHPQFRAVSFWLPTLLS